MRRLSPRLLEGLGAFADHPLVGNVRGVGLVAAVELVADKPGRAAFDPPGSAGALAVTHAQAHGLIIRNLRDIVAFCPPLIISEGELDEMLRRFGKALDEAAEALGRR